MWEDEQDTLTPEQYKAAEAVIARLTDYIEIREGTFQASHADTPIQELAERAEQAYEFVQRL